MFLLLLGGIGNSIKLLEVLLQKLDKLTKVKQKQLNGNVGSKGLDKFVEYEGEEKSLRKSIGDLLLLILRSLYGELQEGSELDECLAFLGEDLKKCAEGNLFSKLNDEGFRKHLEECLKEILKYCQDNNKGAKNKKILEKATNDFSIVLSLTGITAISKLLKIAKNSEYPEEIRALAMSLVNDALSHMKLQHVDNKTAKALIGLLTSSPDNVKQFLYSALKDARTIEKETRKKINKAQIGLNLPDTNIAPGRLAFRNLTLA